MRSSQQVALSVWILHTSAAWDLLGTVVVMVGNMGQNWGEQTPLPRNPQTHTCKQTQVFYFWLTETTTSGWRIQRKTKRQRKGGGTGGPWAIGDLPTSACRNTKSNSCLQGKSAESIMGNCHRHLLPSLWRTPDPAALVPDVPECTIKMWQWQWQWYSVVRVCLSVRVCVTSADSRSLL